MEKTEIAFNVLIAITASIVTEKVIRWRASRNVKPDTTPFRWNDRWNSSLTLPYNSAWGSDSNRIGGEWDNLYKDTSLDSNTVWRCNGPNASKGIIVVTDLYGPLIVMWDGLNLTHKGHPRLSNITVNDEVVFTSSIDPTWLPVLFDPNAGIYTTEVVSGWATMYEMLEAYKKLTASHTKLQDRYNRTMGEMGHIRQQNEDLHKTLHSLLFEGVETTGDLDPSFIGNPSFTTCGHLLYDLPADSFVLESAIQPFINETPDADAIYTANIVELADPDVVAIIEAELEEA